VDILESLEKGLLGYIVGQLLVAHKPVDIAVNLRAEVLVYDDKSLVIAIACALDNGYIHLVAPAWAVGAGIAAVGG
jgi:hypothetical protein